MTRSGRRADNAQAVLETALVIPILLFLVCNFIALMVEVTVQEQLNSATALAAQSRFQAPQNAFDVPGTRCCGAHGVTLVTSGLPTGCRYAAETFYGTMTDIHGPAPLAAVQRCARRAATAETPAMRRRNARRLRGFAIRRRGVM